MTEHCYRFRDLLAQFADNELAFHTRLQVKHHLRACSACRAALAQLNAIKDGLTSLEPPVVSPDLFPRILEAAKKTEVFRPNASRPNAHDRHPWRRVAAAAAFLLLGIAGDRVMLAPKFKQLAELNQRITERHREDLLAKLTRKMACEELLRNIERLKLCAQPTLGSTAWKNLAEQEIRIASLLDVDAESSRNVEVARKAQLADTLLSDGKYQEALDNLGKLARDNPDSPLRDFVELRVASITRDYLRNYSEARERYMSLLKRPFPILGQERQEAIFGMGLTSYALGDSTAATETFKALLETYPNGHRALDATKVSGDVAFEQLFDFESSSNLYQKYLEKLPEAFHQNPEARQVRDRLVLLAENRDNHWEPLRLFMEAEKEMDDVAARKYRTILAQYPSSSLAEKSFEHLSQIESITPDESLTAPGVGGTPAARWKTYLAAAQSFPKDELGAYATLRLVEMTSGFDPHWAQRQLTQVLNYYPTSYPLGQLVETELSHLQAQGLPRPILAVDTRVVD